MREGPYGDHAVVCSKGRGGQTGAWKKARHDRARNILVRMGKAAGLSEGADMEVEVPYLLVHPVPAQRHPGEDPARRSEDAFPPPFEDNGANGFELPGAAPSTRPSRTWPTT
jgi:hypothetical protein